MAIFSLTVTEACDFSFMLKPRCYNHICIFGRKWNIDLFSRYLVLFAASFWIFARWFLGQAMCFLLKIGEKMQANVCDLSSIIIVEHLSCNI